MKDTLEGNEKVIVWIANIINPVIAGFLFYYMWRKRFPNKAKRANRVSFIVFGIEAIAYILYKILLTQHSLLK